MNSLLKKSAVFGLIAMTTLAAALPANAGERWRRHHHHRGDAGAAIAAGALGLAAGALIAGSANRGTVVYRDGYYDRGYYSGGYVEPRPSIAAPVRVYEEPRPVYVERYSSFEPWTRDWYRYCADRYRSFDPSTGTFVGYDGVRRFCEAN